MADIILNESGEPATTEGSVLPPAPVEISQTDDVNADVRAAIETHRQSAEATDDTRPRGPDGKFIPKAAVEATPAPAPIKNTDPDNSTKPAPQASAPAAGPPSSWSADAKANWSRLPPAIQAAVSRREAEVSDGFKQKSEEAKAYAPLRDILEPRKAFFASRGVDTTEAVKQLLGFHDRFESNPADLIRFLAAQKGIDLRSLAAQSPTVDARTAPMAPNARPAQNPDIPSLVAQEMDRRGALTIYQDFVSNPANKHAPNPLVQRAMAQALQLGAKDITEAYDRALWSLPELREELLSERDATAKQATADRTAAARTAAVSLRPGSPNGARPASLVPQQTGGDSIEDDVRAAMRQHGFGAN